MKQTIAEQLSDYVVNTSYSDFSKKSINKAKLCLMDSLGCMVGGTMIETGRILLKYHNELSNQGECTVIGSKTKASVTDVSFLNASLNNALDFDDMYFFHPGSTTIPPALSVAEMISASGEDLLTSILLGYEVGIRINASLNPYFSREKIFGFGTAQVISAVISTGKLLNLNSQKLAHALGIAGCNAPVPSCMKTVFNPLGPNMVKNNYGTASQVGVQAVLLAREGFTGPVNLFEGETGFWQMCGASDSNLTRITKGLDKDNNEILKVRFKSYPACGFLQASLEASVFLMQSHNLTKEEIQNITIKTTPLSCKWPFNNTEPKTPVQAQFSLPHSIAVAISGIEPGPKWFSTEMYHDPTIQMLAKKVRLIPDGETEEKTGNSFFATVEIETATNTFAKTVSIPKGFPKNPFSIKDVEDKFTKLAKPALGNEKTISAIQTIRHLESVSDIRELLIFLYYEVT